jgi:YbbR domain-containing protein
MTVWQWFNPARLYQRLTHLRAEEWKSVGLKLLALGLAFLLFQISRQPLNDIRLVGVPVEFSGLRPGLEIVSDPNTQLTVSLRLRGPRDLVRGLMPNQLAVLANLDNKEPGERVIQLKNKEVSRPDGVEVLRIEPSSITLLLEPTARKTVKVEPHYLGPPDEGLEIYRLTAMPDTLEIEGPQSQLSNLTQVKTESVSLKGRHQSFAATVDVELPHPLLRVVNRASVTVNVELGERRAARSFDNLPVHVSDRTAGARLLTQTVQVALYGPHSAIESLREKDVRVEVDLAALSPTAETARPRVRLPEYLAGQIEIKAINPDEVKVKR